MSYMAIEVRPPVVRPGAMPRSCSREDGTPKVVYLHRKAARRAARLVRPDRPGIQAYRCRYGEHYHLGKRHHADGLEPVWFWEKVDRSRGPAACWLWMGAISKTGGYGVIRGRTYSGGAHRFALEHRLGRSLAPGMVARHRCDNPPCCNPDHLAEGTVSDNALDAFTAGHNVPPRAKLVAAQAVAIRRLLESGEDRHAIAAAFGVSRSTVNDIAAGRSWSHADLPLTCARCGRSDQTVSQTLTLSGVPWPPTCSECAAKASRIRAVERVETGL